MKLDVRADELQSLLAAPSAATLTLYGEDGEAVTSPVWFRLVDGTFEVVVAASDRKLALLRHDPRCVLLIFETSAPYRGVLVRDRADLVLDDGARARRAIASRYLGADAGRAYAAIARRPPGWIVRLPVASARAWSLADRIASGEAAGASPSGTDEDHGGQESGRS